MVFNNYKKGRNPENLDNNLTLSTGMRTSNKPGIYKRVMRGESSDHCIAKFLLSTYFGSLYCNYMMWWAPRLLNSILLSLFLFPVCCNKLCKKAGSKCWIKTSNLRYHGNWILTKNGTNFFGCSNSGDWDKYFAKKFFHFLRWKRKANFVISLTPDGALTSPCHL